MFQIAMAWELNPNLLPCNYGWLETLYSNGFDKKLLYILSRYLTCIRVFSVRIADIKYRYKNTSYNIKVINPNKINRGVKNIYLDGFKVEEKHINLVDDGKEHHVLVEMG